MSLNGYGWVEGNTPNWVDPTGEQTGVIEGLLAFCSTPPGLLTCGAIATEIGRALSDSYAQNPDLLNSIMEGVINACSNTLNSAGTTFHQLLAILGHYTGIAPLNSQPSLAAVLQQSISPPCVGTLGTGNCSDVARRVLERVAESDLTDNTSVIVWADGGELPPTDFTKIWFAGIDIADSFPPIATSFHIYIEFLRDGLSLVWDNTGIFPSVEIYQTLLTPRPPAWRHCKAAYGGLNPTKIARLIEAVGDLGSEARSVNRSPRLGATSCDTV